MFFLVYVSSSVGLFSRELLGDILQKAHANNTKQGITGMLLYKGGNVMQVLGGDETAVRIVFAKISRDPRHKGVIKLIEGEQAERQFGDWTMAYRDLGAPESVMPEGYSDFMNSPLTGEEFASTPARSMKLLRLFKDSVR